ncbi:outer membrane beta-barrel family protein [Albibacterium indicum]|uniref:outer membrane beta-barrel family protein n=1 Tax=Albibacterium indicum TaxID=2292082 RepID=UPI000E4BBAE0|nr:outer membrane beta-barrel family protein [Pedobacter indicus]
MKRPALLLLFFSLVSIFTLQPIYAQKKSTIQGKLIDQSTELAVDFASVAIFNEANTQVAGMLSNENGGFSFDGLAGGEYIIRISFVGYEKYEAPVSLNASENKNLGTILLKPASAEELDEVVIEAELPDMRLGIDRKVFNVSQSLVSEGGSATDLLANVPSLSVDMDGAVSLRGSNNVRILIDGKPSAMAGSDITQTLQSLPANSIQTIEVITNPSSKYDAEGQSGIINIVLKKNVRQGLNGIITASGGSYDNYDGGISLNYRDERFNYYGNYNFRKSNRVGDGFNKNTNLLNNGITENSSENSRKGNGHSGKIGVDYNISERTTVGLSSNFSIRDNNRSEYLFYQYFNQPDLTGTSDRTTEQNEDDLGYDVNLDLRHDFNRPGENLMVNLSYGKSTEDGIQHFNQVFSESNQPDDQRINNTSEVGINTNIQIDYVLPFDEEHRLEAGFRTSIRNDDEEQISDRFDLATNSFVRDYDLTNRFDLEDIVHSIYSNYQNKITDKLGFQVGLRLEQAYLNTVYESLDPSTPEDERETEGKLDYLRLYPSLFLTQELSEGEQLQASYTRRVRRPRGWQVNPFINISDPMNIRMGNPNLLPEDIHSFELSYAKFWPSITFTSSVYHRRVNDGVESIRASVNEETSATVSQWYNISRNDATGFELISKITFSPKIDATANFNAFYNKYFGSEEHNLEPTDGFNWDANISSNVKITNDLTAQVRAQYNAPKTMAQGTSIASFVMDAGAKMDILNKRGSIMLNVRDLFNQRRWGGTTSTAQFSQEFERRWMRRMVTLSLSYRFGRSDFNTKQRDRNQEESFGNDEPQF